MKSICQIILLFLLSVFLFCSCRTGKEVINYSAFESNSSRNFYCSEFILKLEDSVINKYGFQIRLWYAPAGALRKITQNLLVLSRYKNKWKAYGYRFEKSRPNSKAELFKRNVVVLNYDSICRQLVKDSLLSVASLGMGRAEIIVKNNPDPIIFLEGGITYHVELITAEKYRRLEFNNPIEYFTLTKGRYMEFDKPARITSIFLRCLKML